MSQLELPPRVAAEFSPAEIDSLLALRRDLHQHPELSLVERRTAERLRAALAPLRPARLDTIGTAVVARLAGGDPRAPLVALRGDIDALPIQEETGLPFASVHPGVMHACGHDVHASWMVAAAHALVRRPAAGDVLIVLQPAEEVGEGALQVLSSGVLEGVAAIFGGHVDRRFAIGEVVVQAGAVAAAADTFEIELVGKGAHGARPHLGHDPIVAASALVLALQTVVARRLAPGVPAVVTVGQISAGSADNVIPERAQLRGTVRSFDPATRDLLEQEIRHLAVSVGAAHRVAAQVGYRRGCPPVINPPPQTEWALAAARQMLDEGSIVPLPELNLGGEDFAYYLERLPGCFLRVGARERGGAVIGAHTPHFFAADGAIFVGAAVLAELARVASAACLAAG